MNQSGQYKQIRANVYMYMHQSTVGVYHIVSVCYAGVQGETGRWEETVETGGVTGDCSMDYRCHCRTVVWTMGVHV